MLLVFSAVHYWSIKAWPYSWVWCPCAREASAEEPSKGQHLYVNEITVSNNFIKVLQIKSDIAVQIELSSVVFT